MTVFRRGPFFWRTDGTCKARSREGLGLVGDRIAPEEYVEAIKIILDGGQALPRADLIGEVRAVMGYDRTGAILEQAIGSVVDGLVLGRQLGEASTGLVWRGHD
jgi:hypothetical protein